MNPKIDLAALNHLSPEDLELVKGIVNPRTGELRASRPTVPTKMRVDVPDSFLGYEYHYRNEADARKGCTAYIWRMVAFYVSSDAKMSCMPTTASFWLPTSDRELEKRMNAIVDAVVDTIPRRQQYGLNRWAKALGYAS